MTFDKAPKGQARQGWVGQGKRGRAKQGKAGQRQGKAALTVVSPDLTAVLTGLAGVTPGPHQGSADFVFRGGVRNQTGQSALKDVKGPLGMNTWYSLARKATRPCTEGGGLAFASSALSWRACGDTDWVIKAARTNQCAFTAAICCSALDERIEPSSVCGCHVHYLRCCPARPRRAGPRRSG